MPHISPAMKTNFDAYIFPNEEEQSDKTSADNYTIKCNFVGLRFKTFDREQQEIYEDILANYGSLIYQNRTQPDQVKQPGLIQSSSITTTTTTTSQTNTSSSTTRIVTQNVPAEKVPYIVEEVSSSDDEKEKEKDAKSKDAKSGITPEYVAKKIVDGANFIVKGVNTTTETANKYMQNGGEKIKSNLKPNEQPTKISPTVQKTVQGIRHGTNLTVRVSSFLLDKLGQLAGATSKKVAPIIKDSTVSLLSKTGIASNKSTADSYVHGFTTVAASSVHGFTTVYDSLEGAAKSLASSLADQSVNIVDHKYI